MRQEKKLKAGKPTGVARILVAKTKAVAAGREKMGESLVTISRKGMTSREGQRNGGW